MRLLLSTTWKYIRRNPGLSLATIIIISITFSIGTILFLLNLFATQTVNYLQNQPTISIFYDQREKEESIIAFKTFLEGQKGITKVTFSSSTQIQQDYLNSIGINPEQQGQYSFDDYAIRILRLQVEPNTDYKYFLQLIESEKSKGALISQIVFIQEIVDKIREFSNTVRIGGTLVTVFLVAMSLLLIYLTIGFTINRFSQEIDIMQLVGAESKVIMLPFTLQGAFYGVVATLVSYIVMLVLWFSTVFFLGNIQNNTLFAFIKNIVSEVGLGSLFTFSLVHVLFGVILVTLGLVIGISCSYVATKRYIKV